MAKIKKRRLKWTPSSSSQVVGYRLYWSDHGDVNYDSHCITLPNVTEIVLPDGIDSFTPAGGPVVFGITAVDELGNESDMTTLVAPYQFNVPQAPEDLYLQKLDDFGITVHQDDKVDYYLTSLEDDESGEVEPIKLVEAVGSRRGGKSGRTQVDLETVDKNRRIA